MRLREHDVPFDGEACAVRRGDSAVRDLPLNRMIAKPPDPTRGGTSDVNHAVHLLQDDETNIAACWGVPSICTGR